MITCKPYSFLATWFIAAFIQDSFSISQSSQQFMRTHVGFLSKSNQIQFWLILEISCEVLLSAVDNYPLPSTNILSLQYLSRLIPKYGFYSWNIDTYLSYFYPSLTFCCILLVAKILHSLLSHFGSKQVIDLVLSPQKPLVIVYHVAFVQFSREDVLQSPFLLCILYNFSLIFIYGSSNNFFYKTKHLTNSFSGNRDIGSGLMHYECILWLP